MTTNPTPPTIRIAAFSLTLCIASTTFAARDEAKTFYWKGGASADADSAFESQNWANSKGEQPSPRSLVPKKDHPTSPYTTYESFIVEGKGAVMRTTNMNLVLGHEMYLTIRNGAEWQANNTCLYNSGWQTLRLNDGAIYGLAGRDVVEDVAKPWSLYMTNGSRLEMQKRVDGGINFSGGNLHINDSIFTGMFVSSAKVKLGEDGVLKLGGRNNPLNASTVNFTAVSAQLILKNRTPTKVVSFEQNNGKFLVNGVKAIIGEDPERAEPGDNLVIASFENGSVLYPVGGQADLAASAQPTKSMQASSLKKWVADGSGYWIGRDKGAESGSFFEAANWISDDSIKPESGEGFTLQVKGNDSVASADRSLLLSSSSSLLLSDSARVEMNKNAIAYNGDTVVVLDSAALDEVGGLLADASKGAAAKLDLIITNNAVLSMAEGSVLDGNGGTALVDNSILRAHQMVKTNVKMVGYGNIELAASGREALAGSTIELSSTRAQFNFFAKSPADVLDQDLDKFSVNGGLPIYGENPGIKEPGDNIVIRSDGMEGTIVSAIEGKKG